MINLEAVDSLMIQLTELLDPNQTTQDPGERSAPAAPTTVGAGPAVGAGISGTQISYHQNQFSGQRDVPGSLGLGSSGTVAGAQAVKPTDAGISGSQMTTHKNDFDNYNRMPPSVALGLGSAGRSAGGDLDSAS